MRPDARAARVGQIFPSLLISYYFRLESVNSFVSIINIITTREAGINCRQRRCCCLYCRQIDALELDTKRKLESRSKPHMEGHLATQKPAPVDTRVRFSEVPASQQHQHLSTATKPAWPLGSGLGWVYEAVHSEILINQEFVSKSRCSAQFDRMLHGVCI